MYRYLRRQVFTFTLPLHVDLLRVVEHPLGQRAHLKM